LQSLAFLFALFSDKLLITYSTHTHTHTHTYKKLSSKKNIFPTNWAEISISGLYFHFSSRFRSDWKESDPNEKTNWS